MFVSDHLPNAFRYVICVICFLKWLSAAAGGSEHRTSARKMPIYRYSVLEAPPETHDIQYSLLFQLIAIRTRVKRMDGSDKEKKERAPNMSHRR